jgi:hypothetical protein
MSARARSAAISAFFICEAVPAQEAGQYSRVNPQAARLFEPGRQFRHGDVGLSFHNADQETGKGNQSASAARTPLTRRCTRTVHSHAMQKLHREAIADLKMASRRATRMAALDKRNNPIPKVRRIALAHDPPPKTVNHKSHQKGISDSSFESDALEFLARWNNFPPSEFFGDRDERNFS